MNSIARYISYVFSFLARFSRVLPICGLLLSGGCVTREALHDSVYAERQDAYERWYQKHMEEQNSLPEISGKLSLEDALKLALKYNKSLLAVLQEKESARGGLIESYAEALPKVSGVANYTRLDEVGGFNVGGQDVSIGSLDNYAVDLNVRQPLFRGGAVRAGIRSARMFSYITDENVREKIQATVFKTAHTYYQTLLAQQLYEVNKDAVKSAEAQLKDVKIKFSQDMASRFDVLRAEVDVSNFEAEMIKQRNRLNLARMSLLKTMGVSQETDVVLTDELVYEPMTPVLEEAVRIAHLNRPDLYKAELGVRLQEEAVRIARSRYWPKIDAVLNQGWARPHPHNSQDEWGDQWTAGVQLELSIFDGFGRKGRLIQENAALRRKKIESLDVEEQALLDIQQALLAIHDAEEFVESQKLNLQRAREGLRLAEVGYREGINTEVEVVDARAALTHASGLHYQAVYDHTIARLLLQQAMGILGPRADNSSEPEELANEPFRINLKEINMAGQTDSLSADEPAEINNDNNSPAANSADKKQEVSE